jgi:urease subunit gamma/beta
VHLSLHEQERLMIYLAGEVAEKRLKRRRKSLERRENGEDVPEAVALNYPEAVAYLSAHVLEGARNGKTVTELMNSGTRLLTHTDVMPGVPEMIEHVQVEATFPDGTKLVTITDPIALQDEEHIVPGEIAPPEDADEIPVNATLTPVPVTVLNTGDRPVQVGSHYHFFEANPALEIRPRKASPSDAEPPVDRDTAYGMRLNIPAGTSRRFEPSKAEEVTLVPIEGERIIRGLRGEVKGKLKDRGATR